jgi:hypothetical protein
MRRTTLAAALAALLAAGAAAARDKQKPEGAGAAAASPVIARVNGEDVTKAEFDAVVKANQRFFDLTVQATRDRLKGRPLTEYLFREEIVTIRAVAQRHKDDLPGMKAAIEQARDRVAGGADFGEVAKEMSQEPPTAERGGALGEPKGFADLVHPFNRVALSLKEGGVSDPVLSIFGYHLIKVDKIIPPMELKPKRVQVRHILIRYPGDADPRKEAEEAAAAVQVEILDKSYCKKLPAYCGEGDKT